jgi:hypothetical protein
MNATVATISASRPRITLKQLFAILTAVAIVLAPAHWFRGAYLVSAFFSISLVALCVLTYRSSRFGALLVAIFGALVRFFLVIVLMVYFFHAALTVTACLILCALGLPTRTFAITLTAVMVAVYGYAFAQGALASRDIRELKAKYPFKSLRDRLAFEQNNTSSGASIEPIELSPAITKNLDDQDDFEQYHFYSRSGALRELHEASYREFARAAGFGFMRMDSLRYRLALDETEFKFDLPAPITISAPKNATQSLTDTHTAAVDDFISPGRIGYARRRDEVAGFESHRFRSLNERWQYANYTANNPQQWQVVRLELVGLLRHNEPRVYTAERLPSMDKLVDVAHRPLNNFEKTALPKLVTQEDIVINQQPNRIEMLGALRAGKTCLECHEGERGKLLGAFSYEIVRIPATKTADSVP